MPPLAIKPPQFVHHMADVDHSGLPQNSLEGVAASLDAGAAIIEVDITALAEGDYLLVHDAELESETSGAGRVVETTPDQVRALWIKTKSEVTGYRVPLLSEVVQRMLAHSNKAVLQLDFKDLIPFAGEEPLRRLVQLIEPLGENVIVSSGADWQLRRLRRLAPWLRLGFDVMLYIGWLPPGQERDPREYPKNLGAYGYYDDHLLATGKFYPTAEYLHDRSDAFILAVPDVSVFYLEHHLIAQSLRDGFNWAEKLHQHGILLDAWTMDVTNPAALENAPILLEAGVDLFTSNTPKALAAYLKENHPHKT